jgi:glutamate/tyrosine decarboxylase-like PLP-dependent enzyme
VLRAGNVTTGHSDPFSDLIPRCRQVGVWVYIDGAFGLSATASRRPTHTVAGVQQADSWATDGHKWLNMPYDCGIPACTRRQDLLRAMQIEAAYLATEERNLMYLGVQMSQAARGVIAWAVPAHVGRSGVAALVDRAYDHPADFVARLRAGGATLLAPPILNQVLLRFDDGQTTDATITAVQADGTCWPAAPPGTACGRRA